MEVGLVKRAALKRSEKRLARTTGLRRSVGLRSQRKRLDRGKAPTTPRSQPKARTGVQKQRSISPATPAQRRKAKAQGCIVCRQGNTSGRCGPVQPAHVIDRSLLSEGQDEPLAVVGLGAQHHRQYDDEQFDLLPYLERHAKPELAFAVERYGLLKTLQRVTGSRWTATPIR